MNRRCNDTRQAMYILGHILKSGGDIPWSSAGCNIEGGGAIKMINFEDTAKSSFP